VSYWCSFWASGRNLQTRLHKKNIGFDWQQPEPPFELVSEVQARAYREQGGFILPAAFSRAELEPLLLALDDFADSANRRLENSASNGPSISRAHEIVFDAHVVARSEVARRFARHSVFQRLCRDLIGAATRLYWDQLVYKHPGTADDFPWHQDNGYTYVEPQQYLTCWVALTPATLDNGCPWIAPGYHRGGTLAHQWTDVGFRCFEPAALAADEVLAMPLEAGSIAVFSSLTPHRTGPNMSTDVRKAYILQYAPDGALVHGHDGTVVSADNPERQFLIDERNGVEHESR